MMYGWIIGVILIFVLIVALGRGGIFHKGASPSTSKSSAMETLKNRYAKGEIDKAEFEERKAELKKTK
ncbi:putative membrane protein [Marivirga sericea]|uniref:Putative membrane protein n=1 Tax=Marivirga sericea TaxID=1028 RepID=A0A1X7J6X6_9BACT|nr:SHOCT domain-containing protein [Marivirga sericea]SMG23158.1 putative membrane protein [Marivirga sericea]